MVKGISGGTVYNQDSTIGGVIIGYTREVKKHNSAVPLKEVSLYIPCQDFKDWLTKSTS